MHKNIKPEDVYEFIKDYILTNMYPPSIREIGRGIGLESTSSVYYHILKLEKMGKITFSQGKIALVGYKIVKE